jgi:hypothetical protein
LISPRRKHIFVVSPLMNSWILVNAKQNQHVYRRQALPIEWRN